MTTGPTDPDAPSRAVRRRRRAARVIAVVAALVVAAGAARLGFVDLADHPGTVGVVVAGIVVFVLAFPFTGIGHTGPRRRTGRG